MEDCAYFNSAFGVRCSAFSRFLLPNRRFPGFVGVVGGHGLGDAAGFGAEVFLEDFAALVDDEGHDAGVAVFGGPGDEGEAANHVAVDDVIVFAAGSVFALAGEDFEVVAVIGTLIFFNIGEQAGAVM